MPRSYYDRFADTPVGNAFLRFTLGGIDKHPSFLQRAAVNAALGGAYLLDKTGFASRTPRDTDMPGGAGAGGYPSSTIKRKYARAPTRRNIFAGGRKRYGRVKHYGAAELGMRAQQHVRGVGVLRGKYRTTPGPVRQNIRNRVNMPLSVAHEVRTELRCNPGNQAVVTCIAQQRMPKSDYSGELIDGVNLTDAGGALAPVIGAGRDTVPVYRLATDDAPTNTVMNHRNDWTMFTNGSWRDGYAFTNGQLNDISKMQTGYSTPYATAGSTYGNPEKWYEAPAILLDPSGTTREAVTEEMPDAPSASAAVVTNLQNYYHLYEEISWTIHNPSITGTVVTIYECILNRDMPMQETLTRATTGTVIDGGLPSPIELWRQSNAIQAARVAGLTMDGAVYQVAAPEAVASAETAGIASCTLGTTPTSAGVAAGMLGKDVDYPNATPHRAQLLHTYYKVIPHSRRIPPGASTTITIGVKYNKRIPGAWWNTMYGVSGMTRSFFMVARPDEVVGVTGADEDPGTTPLPANRTGVMNATDLIIRWVKKKSCAKVKQQGRRTFFYKAAVPEIDDVTMRNLITGTVHDADAVAGSTAEGGMQAEYA